MLKLYETCTNFSHFKNQIHNRNSALSLPHLIDWFKGWYLLLTIRSLALSYEKVERWLKKEIRIPSSYSQIFTTFLNRILKFFLPTPRNFLKNSFILADEWIFFMAQTIIRKKISTAKNIFKKSLKNKSL